MIVDTNVYTALQRGDQAAVNALRGIKTIKLPIPVIAELHFGFLNGTKRSDNESKLIAFMAQANVSTLLPTEYTASIYAEIATYCKRQGKALSHNDIWIAALAKESGDVLVTYDKDFAGIEGVLGDRLVVLEN